MRKCLLKKLEDLISFIFQQGFVGSLQADPKIHTEKKRTKNDRDTFWRLRKRKFGAIKL